MLESVGEKVVALVVAAAALLGLAAPAQASPAYDQYVWQKQTVAALPIDADGEEVFFTGTQICAESYRSVRLTCWNVKSGAPSVRYEQPTPGGGKATALKYHLDGDTVTLAYQVGGKVLVRVVDLTNGAERRAFDFPLSDMAGPVARTFELSGSSLVVVYRAPDPKGAKDARNRPKWHGRARVVSAENGSLVRDFDLEAEPFLWDLSGETLYIQRSAMPSDAVNGYDITTGKKRFAHPFPGGFIHGIAAGPDGVYVQLDAKVVRLDKKSGQEKGSAAIGREGNPGPVVAGDRVYVCESGLHVFDLALKRLARVALPGWVISCDVRAGYANVDSHHVGYLVDLGKNQLLATKNVREEKFMNLSGVFDGTALPFTETESTTKTRSLVRLVKVPAVELEVAGLPAGTAVLEDGVPVGPRVAQGEHQLDLFRAGFRPYRYRLNARGASARVDAAAVKWEAAPAATEPRFDHLPADVELTQLAALRQRSESTFPYGTFGNFTDRGRRVGLEPRNGLFARTLRGNDVWNVPMKDIEALAGKSSGSSSGPKLFAVLPQARLALIWGAQLSPAPLLAYDLDTGKLRWKAESTVHNPPYPGEYYFKAAGEYSGAFWFVTSEAIYGHDLKDGHLVYFHDFGLREGTWGLPVFHDGVAYIIHRESVVGLDLAKRELVMRAKVPGRGFLTLGPGDQYLLFVDDKSARAISFTGKQLAQSPQLAGGLDDNPVLLEPDAIYLCGHYKLQTHALDPKTLRPRWTFTNKSGGQSLCPSLFSEHQVASIDNHRTVILDRKTGKVLLDQMEGLPDSSHVAADGNGYCFHIRKGSACLDK